MLVQCNIADISLDEAPQNLENKLKDYIFLKTSSGLLISGGIRKL